MINVNTLDELGVEVPFEDASGSCEVWEKLEDAVRDSADGVEIAVFRQRPYGILLRVDDELRRDHPVVGDAYPVLWHTDNDMDDASCGLNLVDEATADELVKGSTSAVVSDVIEHYKKRPAHDGNPAYRLYMNWLAERDAENADTVAVDDMDPEGAHQDSRRTPRTPGRPRGTRPQGTRPRTHGRPQRADDPSRRCRRTPRTPGRPRGTRPQGTRPRTHGRPQRADDPSRRCRRTPRTPGRPRGTRPQGTHPRTHGRPQRADDRPRNMILRSRKLVRFTVIYAARLGTSRLSRSSASARAAPIVMRISGTEH